MNTSDLFYAAGGALVATAAPKLIARRDCVSSVPSPETIALIGLVGVAAAYMVGGRRAAIAAGVGFIVSHYAVKAMGVMGFN